MISTLQRGLVGKYLHDTYFTDSAHNSAGQILEHLRISIPEWE